MSHTILILHLVLMVACPFDLEKDSVWFVIDFFITVITIVADETPTPTRFIRNCEEVGLFQDLNVNPFDGK